jgi:hypothetical protein
MEPFAPTTTIIYERLSGTLADARAGIHQLPPLPEDNCTFLGLHFYFIFGFQCNLKSRGLIWILILI